MNLKNIKKSLKFLLLTTFLVSLPQEEVEAARATTYINPHQREGFIDKEVPATIQLTQAVDGLPSGTVLYRHSHEAVDYYSPIVPTYLKGTVFDVSQGKNQDWGPWKMAGNNESGISMNTYKTYTSAVTTKTVTVHTNLSAKQLGSHKTAGTLPAGTTLKVLSYRSASGRLFIDLTPHTALANNSTTKVGSILVSNGGLSLSGEKSVLHDGYKSNVHFLHFKKMANYGSRTTSHYADLQDARYVNPSYAPSHLAGKKGEWRFIGYNAKGEPMDNPYFVADDLAYTGNAPMSGYPWRLTPWNPNDASSDPDEEDTIDAYNSFSYGRSSFPYDQGSYDTQKRALVKKIHNTGALTPTYPTDAQADVMVKKLSLVSHPTKQSAILVGQNKYNTHNRIAFVENDGLRDLYFYDISVIDNVTGQNIVTGYGSINGPGTSYNSGNVYKGRTYTVRVRLANGANSELIASSLKAQIGFTYNASINSNMNIGGTQNSQSLLIGNKGHMYHTTGSPSANFDFQFTVGENQTGSINVYGFVGDEHQGVDNTKYHNDTGFVRLYINSTPPPPPADGCTIYNNGRNKICGQLDMEVYAIQIKKPDGTEVYREIYGYSPEKKFAPIPGNNYYIEYTGRFKGDHILEYTWIDPISDNPNTSANEYVPGRWSSGALKYYNNIKLNYYVTKYSGGINQEDTVVKNSAGPMYDVNFSTTNLPAESGSFFKFKTEVMTFQHPYVNTAFKLISPDSRLNSNTNNDRMETTIKDTYDIKMTNFRVYPSKTIVQKGTNKVNYTVGYDLELITPSYVNKGDYQTLIDTTIEINGQSFVVQDYLTVGHNKNLTHTISNVTVQSNGGSTFTGKAVANSSKTSYETNFNNNSGSASISALELPSPTLGSPNDKVGTPDSLNSNNSNKGGDALNNCLYPRTKNSWTLTHRQTSWSASNITYNTSSTNKSVTFKKYSTTADNDNAATYTYQETFNIDKILFRSKDTKDKGYGDNGWVNLLDSNQQKQAIIKAGYGFELKIVTKYNTDAFTKKTWSVSNNGTSGTFVTNLPGTPNYGLQDVFLELPGTSSTRKILSSTGYGNTYVGLNMTKNINSTSHNGEWTYTIKPTNTLGVGSEAKIYIPTDMKDGEYTLKIYTPSVNGVSSWKNTYSSLCDRKEVKITVKGAASNDLNSHETQ